MASVTIQGNMPVSVEVDTETGEVLRQSIWTEEQTFDLDRASMTTPTNETPTEEDAKAAAAIVQDEGPEAVDWPGWRWE